MFLLAKDDGQTIDLSAKEDDSVQTSKTKIMESQMIAFREQDLKLDGKVLEEAVSFEDSALWMVPQWSCLFEVASPS